MSVVAHLCKTVNQKGRSLYGVFLLQLCVSYFVRKLAFCAENIHKKLMTCLGVWLLPFSFLFLCFLLNCSHLGESMECFFLRLARLFSRIDPYCCIKH